MIQHIFTERRLRGATAPATGKNTVSKPGPLSLLGRGWFGLTCLSQATGGLVCARMRSEGTSTLCDVLHRPERVSDLPKVTQSSTSGLEMPIFRVLPVLTHFLTTFAHFLMQGVEGGGT